MSMKDPAGLDSRTGNDYYIREGLATHGVRTEIITPNQLGFQYEFLYRIERQYYKRVRRRRFASHYEPVFLRRQAMMADKIIAEEGFDCVLANSPRAIAYLKCSVPKMFWTDSSFAGALGFIPSGKSLSRRHISTCHEIEQRALDNCTFAVYSSSWAAETAVSSYEIDRAKIRIIPRGANIEVQVGRTMAEVQGMIDARPADRIRMLFLAGEWYNKRGRLAVEVARILNDWGIPTELDIVGTVPEEVASQLPSFVRYHGFIDKSETGGLTRITSIIARSHFLIMPSFAECVGIQHEEASAFGVPSLGTDVGGTSSVVRNGVTGRLFHRDAPAEEYASFIKQIFADRERYEELCVSAFDEYCQHFNWNTCAATMLRLIESVVEPRDD